MENKPQLSSIGVIGLAVMGQNLVLNIADHGFRVSVYNRTASKMRAFVDQNPHTPGGLVGFEQLKDFVASLEKPRKAVIMVQAGAATQAVIEELVPLLEPGDMIIDGGNAHWLDTLRREAFLKEKGIFFIGSGVSGGEEGARFGPSLMPGGDRQAWAQLEPIWKAIAAKVDPQTGQPLDGALPGKPIQGGEPCTAYIGPSGAGHYVKMVHNGIEYSDMQLICEAYAVLRDLLGLSAQAIAQIFKTWNQGVLNSFLVEITAIVLEHQDPKTGRPFVDIVLDEAGQKGTGKWTAMHALELGVTAPTIAESVFARCMSALKAERVRAAAVLKGPCAPAAGVATLDAQDVIQSIQQALYCSKICSYAQGFQLMAQAQKLYNWELPFADIAKVWRGGCIIRAAFLQKITEAYQRDPQLPNLLLDPYFSKAILDGQAGWRKVVAWAAQYGVAVPNFGSALAYFDSYRNPNLPQNLLQAQRDYFGAHTYRRTDAPDTVLFHTQWQVPGRPEVEVS
jgi:6-phosphogluconate dehydrogenase